MFSLPLLRLRKIRMKHCAEAEFLSIVLNYQKNYRQVRNLTLQNPKDFEHFRKF